MVKLSPHEAHLRLAEKNLAKLKERRAKIDVEIDVQEQLIAEFKKAMN